MDKHWSKVEYLHEVVTNKNIILKGTKSYYSNAWTAGFEDYCVRYLYGDKYSISAYETRWEVDKLYIGNYVCIGGESIIIMGGNSTHRPDWFSIYPFMETIEAAYQSKGDTHIDDGVWLGMRVIIMPGVHIGEGAVVAAGSVVTKDLAPYCIYGGAPAKFIRKRFEDDTISKLLQLKIYDRSEVEIQKLIPVLSSKDVKELGQAIIQL